MAHIKKTTHENLYHRYQLLYSGHTASYPLDVAHSFWIKFKLMADEGKIISIDKVKKELFKNDDSLKDWCSKNLPQDFFKEFSSSAMPEYAKLFLLG